VPSLLSADRLKVQFSSRKTFVTAVDDFSMTIEAGECVGLVGESGCGETTTGLAIMRLLPGSGKLAAGSVHLNGVDLSTLSGHEMQEQRGQLVALIPQDLMSSLNPTMRIGRQIGEGLRIQKGTSDAEGRQRALEVREMVGMPRPAERLDRYPFELSGGRRQRVIIAVGLVCEPSLLIADEPTTALDVTIQVQILDLIDRLRTDLNMGVLLITHDMGVIAGRTDRVIVMYGGKKAEEATTSDLFFSMHHPYAQAPRFDAEPREHHQARPGVLRGPAAGPLEGDHRLSIRAAVRVRDGPVPSRGSAAHHLRGSRVGLLSPCEWIKALVVCSASDASTREPPPRRRAASARNCCASRDWSRSSR
jgi:peptide/nickel transport system ATP-binding protein